MQSAPHRYRAREVRLMEALAREAAIALNTQRLRDAHAQAEAAQREREAQVRLLLDSTAEAIYGVDTQGLCTFVNPACLRMLGYARERDLIGQSMHALIHHTYPDGQPYPKEQCLVRLSVLQGLSAHSDQEVHWRADGTSMPVEYWSHPVYRNGALVGAVVTFVDITERKRVEHALRQHQQYLEELVAARTEELRAVNRELEAFSYSVSHDLRAPLRSIDGFSLALLEDYGAQLDAGARALLERVRRATQKMGRLIDDLLDLARVTRVDMQRTPLDLSALAREAIDELRLAEPTRTVSVHIQPDMHAVADPGLLKIVLENLLGNAWKYTSNRAHAHIEFRSRQRNGEIVFSVTDDGAGFDPRYADRLFSAFQRLHSDRDFSGTGVGLATVQRVIRRHGGSVWAEGETGRGATFYFALRAVPAPTTGRESSGA
jgi:PAS domain S-box-containing protein